jgi:hypothetical protein
MKMLLPIEAMIGSPNFSTTQDVDAHISQQLDTKQSTLVNAVKLPIERHLNALGSEIFHELSVQDKKQSDLSEQIRHLGERLQRTIDGISSPKKDQRARCAFDEDSARTKAWLDKKISSLNDERYEAHTDLEGAEFQKSIVDMVELMKGGRPSQKLFWCKYFAQHYKQKVFE